MEPPRTPNVPDTVIASEIVRTAIADLRGRLNDGDAEIEVVSVDEVDWPDGSIGCPQPGMGYTQALLPGYRVRLRAGRREFDYHASARGQWILCPPGRATDPVPRDAI